MDLMGQMTYFYVVTILQLNLITTHYKNKHLLWGPIQQVNKGTVSSHTR